MDNKYDNAVSVLTKLLLDNDNTILNKDIEINDLLNKITELESFK